MLHLQKVTYDKVKNIYKYVDKSAVQILDSDNIEDVPADYCPYICEKSNLFCLDIDVKGARHKGFSNISSNYDTIINLLQFDTLRCHYAEDTRSLGVHILFYVSDEFEAIARQITTTLIDMREYIFTVECYYKTDRLIYSTTCTKFTNIKSINKIDTFIKHITLDELLLIKDTLDSFRKEPEIVEKNKDYKPCYNDYSKDKIREVLNYYAKLINEQSPMVIYQKLGYSSYCEFWVNIGLALYNTNKELYDVFEEFSRKIPVNEDDTEEYQATNTLKVWNNWSKKEYSNNKLHWRTIESNYIYHFCDINIDFDYAIKEEIPNYISEDYIIEDEIVEKKETVKKDIESEEDIQQNSDIEYKLLWANEILAFVKKKDNHFFMFIYEYYLSLLEEHLKNEYNAVILTITFILSLYYDKLEFIYSAKFKIHLRFYSIYLASSGAGKNALLNSFSIIHKDTKITYASMQKMHQMRKFPDKRSLFNIIDEFMKSRHVSILSQDNNEFNIAFKRGVMQLFDNNNDFTVESSVSSGSFFSYKFYYSFTGFSAISDFPPNIDVHGGGFNRCFISYLIEKKTDDKLLQLSDDEIASLPQKEHNDPAKSIEIQDAIISVNTDINKRFNIMTTGTEKSQAKIFMDNLEAKKKLENSEKNKDKDKEIQIKYNDDDYEKFEYQLIKVYKCNLMQYLQRLSSNMRILNEKNRLLSKEVHERNEHMTNKIIMALFLDNDVLNKVQKYGGLNTELNFNTDFDEIKPLFLLTNNLVNNERIKFTKQSEEQAKTRYEHKAKETLQIKEMLAKKEQEIKDYFVTAFTKPERLNIEYNLKSCYSVARKMKQYLTSAYEKEFNKIINDLVSDGRLIINKERTKFKFVR